MSPEAVRLRPATSTDWPAIRDLLESNHLPVAGAAAHLADFIVAECDGRIVGCSGMERYGRSALLRSAAVAETMRSLGIGGQLVARLLDLAKQQGVDDIALLTTTAEAYFSQLGFRTVPREELVASFGASEEMRGACPASAVAMRCSLPRGDYSARIRMCDAKELRGALNGMDTGVDRQGDRD